MKTWHKIGIVGGGYVVAFVLASIVTAVYVASTNTPDRSASSGMYAFGDMMFFLGCFGLAAIPSTAAGLYFLRPHAAFWRAASVGAIALASTAVAALILYLAYRGLGPGAGLQSWAMLSPLRILLAPGLAVAFLLCALFAPTRGARIAFVCAGAVETVVFVWVALIWAHAVR